MVSCFFLGFSSCCHWLLWYYCFYSWTDIEVNARVGTKSELLLDSCWRSLSSRCKNLTIPALWILFSVCHFFWIHYLFGHDLYSKEIKAFKCIPLVNNFWHVLHSIFFGMCLVLFWKCIFSKVKYYVKLELLLLFTLEKRACT